MSNLGCRDFGVAFGVQALDLIRVDNSWAMQSNLPLAVIHAALFEDGFNGAVMSTVGGNGETTHDDVDLFVWAQAINQSKDKRSMYSVSSIT